MACAPAYGESDKLSKLIDEVFAEPGVSNVQTRFYDWVKKTRKQHDPVDLKTSAETLCFRLATPRASVTRRHKSGITLPPARRRIVRLSCKRGFYPSEFEGVSCYFLYSRSVDSVTRKLNNLSEWLYLHSQRQRSPGAPPELLSDVLSDHELRETRRRLGLIQRFAGQELSFGPALHRTFDRVVQNSGPTHRRNGSTPSMPRQFCGPCAADSPRPRSLTRPPVF
jgi:hypothetical protein